MNNPQNFDPTQRISDRTQQLGDRTQQLGDRTNQLSSPTVATPSVPQPAQPTAWSEQDPYDGGGYAPYGDAPTDNYYDQPPQYFDQPPHAYGQQPMAVPMEPPVPWYRKPGVLFGGAAGAALLAVAALIATWQMGGVSTTPANTTGTPSQQVLVPLAPAPTQAPAPAAACAEPASRRAAAGASAAVARTSPRAEQPGTQAGSGLSEPEPEPRGQAKPGD